MLNLNERLSDEIKIRVWVAEDPLTCVVRGAALVLDDLDLYSQFLARLDRSGSR